MATAGHNRATLAQQGLSGASLVSFPYPDLKTAHRVAQGRVWFFLPRTSLPLPLKGEGRGITFLGLVGFALLVQNWGTLAQQGRSGASLVSFPYPAPKIAHRAARGRVWFWPAGWRLSGGLSSLSAIPCKKSSRRKNTPACFSKIEPVKFAIPCKRLSKSPEENFFSLFSGADFALPQADPQDVCSTVFSHTNSGPGLSMAGPSCITSFSFLREPRRFSAGKDGCFAPEGFSGASRQARLRPCPARSNLYATASWMGRIVYRSTPFCTLPSLPWTVVFSVSMSLFSSNR